MSDSPTGERLLKLHTERLEFVNVDGEVVVLDKRRSMYYGVNETGGRLWSALREGATEAELLQILVDEHDVTQEQAAADLAAFVQQLDDAGLLER
jgi:chromosome segregation ATPase